MSTDQIRRIGKNANCCLSTPGSLGTEVSNLARATADVIEAQQKTINRLERELRELRSAARKHGVAPVGPGCGQIAPGIYEDD
jgi:hypothetical protein